MSTMETASGLRPSTALATRCAIAITLFGASRAPGFRRSRTLAFAGCFRFEKDGVFGEGEMYPGLFDFDQRHGRALEFAFQCAAIVHMLGEVRGAEVGLIKQLEPDSARLGQSGGGKISRNSATFADGTSTVPPFSATRYCTPVPFSRSTTAPASSGASALNSGRKSLSRRHRASPNKPPPARAAAIRIEVRWRDDRPAMMLSQLVHAAPLHLHAHDFLVRLNDFVPDLNKQLQAKLRTLSGQHRGMQFSALPGKRSLDCSVRGGAVLLNRADRGFQYGGEIRRPRFPVRPGRSMAGRLTCWIGAMLIGVG